MKLKPLQWQDYPGGQRCAATPFRADYWVKRYPDNHPFRAGQWSADACGRDVSFQSFHATAEEAMSACEQHLTSFIGAWIE